MVGSSSAHLGARLTSIMADGSRPRQVGLETVKSCPGQPQNASTSFCHWSARLHRKSERVIKGFSCGWEEATVNKTPECSRKAQLKTAWRGSRGGDRTEPGHAGDVCPIMHIMSLFQWLALKAKVLKIELIFINWCTSNTSPVEGKAGLLWNSLKALELSWLVETASAFLQ